MGKCARALLMVAVCFGLPLISEAQNGGTSTGVFSGMQGVLDKLYKTMIVNASALIGVSKGIAGFAAMWYIAVRVWGHISRAEPVDFYPLFKPFVIGFAIINFSSVIDLMDGIMQPVVDQTATMVTNANAGIAALLAQKQAALQNTTEWLMYVGASGSGSEELWEVASGEADVGPLSGLNNWAKFEMAKASYNIKNSIKVWLSEILQTLFEAAALCINTVRTFYRIILAILGPLVFGLSIFDGMQHLRMAWITRYINIFLWLPVANIFGSLIGQVEQQMIQLDIQQLNANGQTSFGSTDAVYIVFLIMGIVGYFTIPSVANYIVNAGGGNTLLYKITNTANSAAGSVTNSVRSVASSVFGSSGSSGGGGSSGGSFGGGSGSGGSGGGSSSAQSGKAGSGGYLENKLKGGND